MNQDLVFFTCINILLAWSVYVVLLSGSLSFAQGAFMSVGCYAAGVFTTKLGLPLIPALALGGLFTAAFAAVLGFPALRVKGVYLILVTLGITICVRIALENIDFLGGVGGFGGMVGANMYIGLCVVVIVGLCLWLISKTPLQLTLDAVREDENVAASMGINVTYIKVASFSVGALIAGIAGGLYGHYINFVRPDLFDVLISIYAVFFVILGGVNNFLGPVIGAVVMTVLPEYMRVLQEWRPTVFSAVILGILLFRPDGLLAMRFATAHWRARRSKSAKALG